MSYRYSISTGPEFDLGGEGGRGQEFVLTVEHEEEFPPEQWRSIVVCAIGHAKAAGKEPYIVTRRVLEYLEALGFRSCGSGKLESVAEGSWCPGPRFVSLPHKGVRADSSVRGPLVVNDDAAACARVPDTMGSGAICAPGDNCAGNTVEQPVIAASAASVVSPVVVEVCGPRRRVV